MVPDNLLYTESHEWVNKEDDGTVRVGITRHAVEELQDLVYLDLKDTGTELNREDPIGEVESVKAVADIYAPVAGTVTGTNDTLADDLDTLYDDPYGDGWLIVLDPDDPGDLDDLMPPDEYKQHISHD